MFDNYYSFYAVSDYNKVKLSMSCLLYSMSYIWFHPEVNGFYPVVVKMRYSYLSPFAIF